MVRLRWMKKASSIMRFEFITKFGKHAAMMTLVVTTQQKLLNMTLMTLETPLTKTLTKDLIIIPF